MGAKISVQAVRSGGTDDKTSQIRELCTKIIEDNTWTDYIDLRSKVMEILRSSNIFPHTILVENIVHPGMYTAHRIHIENNSFTHMGENYIVLKRTGSCCHYNFRLIVAW
jgi:ABC-type polar amino acid transport system ATPase subunit